MNQKSTQYDHIIIGFGKGGKTLAGALASNGESVALIEKDEKMFGGTCINVACIPTKFLENQSRISNQNGGSFEERAARYQKAIKDKRVLTKMLREKNYQKAISQGVDVIVGEASFLDAHHIKVEDNLEELILQGKNIYINTGARPIIPDIEGINESQHVYTSETMMEREELPEHLVIIGGGYIGLEFASYYTNFGSKVTVIQDGSAFIPREDREISQVVLENLQQRGIQILMKTKTLSIHDEVITIQNDKGIQKLQADAILIATGRRANIEKLHLENAGIHISERGSIVVDETLRTNIPNIWAMGDVTGGLQFTYISLDDSRIIRSQIKGDGYRTTKNRGAIPYTVFLDPPLSRVGMTEQEAHSMGYRIKIGKLPVMAIPKAHVIQKPMGMMKVIMDEANHQILGAHFFAAESHEMINLVKLAIDQKIPYQVLRDSIYNHPTMTESFNDLFL